MWCQGAPCTRWVRNLPRAGGLSAGPRRQGTQVARQLATWCQLKLKLWEASDDWGLPSFTGSKCLADRWSLPSKFQITTARVSRITRWVLLKHLAGC